MELNFCTYFDRHYLDRGLLLYRSLRRHCPNARLYVLCLDSWCMEILSALACKRLYPIDLSELEGADPQLLQTKLIRTRIEYYFTLTPCLVRYLLTGPRDLNHVTYLDADLFFFSDPGPLITGLASQQIGIVAHRYSPGLGAMERFGMFNVAFNYFKRGYLSLACLDRWRDQCLTWCHDRIGVERFADQKYLDEWPRLYGEHIVIDHPGVDLAPWNLKTHNLTEHEGRLMVDNQSLIFFHYHGVSRFFGSWYDPNLRLYGKNFSKTVKQCIYFPYVCQLEALRYRYGNIIKGNSIRYKTPNTTSKRTWTTLTHHIIDKAASMALTFFSGTLIHAETNF